MKKAEYRALMETSELRTFGLVFYIMEGVIGWVMEIRAPNAIHVKFLIAQLTGDDVTELSAKTRYRTTLKEDQDITSMTVESGTLRIDITLLD